MSGALSRWTAKLVGRRRLAGHALEMWFTNPSEVAAADPGQFVLFDLGEGLPHAFSPFRQTDARFSILLRPGSRTAHKLAAWPIGHDVPATGFLGRGFPSQFPSAGAVHLVAEAGRLPGYPMLAARVTGTGRACHLWMAGQASERAGADVIRKAGAHVHLRSARGSGLRAALAALAKDDVLAVAGPADLLQVARSAATERHIPCFLALESVFGCGVGACLGCPVAAAHPCDPSHPYLRVCADGPVFEAQEVIL